jgi:hypothetical protein
VARRTPDRKELEKLAKEIVKAEGELAERERALQVAREGRAEVHAAAADAYLHGRGSGEYRNRRKAVESAIAKAQAERDQTKDAVAGLRARAEKLGQQIASQERAHAQKGIEDAEAAVGAAEAALSQASDALSDAQDALTAAEHFNPETLWNPEVAAQAAANRQAIVEQFATQEHLVPLRVPKSLRAEVEARRKELIREQEERRARHRADRDPNEVRQGENFPRLAA